jgi:hypothetical protein
MGSPAAAALHITSKPRAKGSPYTSLGRRPRSRQIRTQGPKARHMLAPPQSTQPKKLVILSEASRAVCDLRSRRARPEPAEGTPTNPTPPTPSPPFNHKAGRHSGGSSSIPTSRHIGTDPVVVERLGDFASTVIPPAPFSWQVTYSPVFRQLRAFPHRRD